VNIIILHRDDKRCLLKLDDETRTKLEAFGAEALEMIRSQDPLLWAHASDTGFMKIIKQGACVLRCIGVHTIIPITDASAHCAFVTCCLLALRLQHLSTEDRRTVRVDLLMLAECCTVQIDRALVPPFLWLPKKVKKASRVTRTYRKMLNHEHVSLADLLRLLVKLESALTPSLVVIGCELRKVTEGLRKALEQTAGRKRRTGGGRK